MNDHIKWAVSRWEAEVKNRPLRNIHRRALDDAWRQVIRHYGGDDIGLCGPAHDELVNDIEPRTQPGGPSEEELQAAARALFQVEWAPALAKGMISLDHDATMKYWTESARAALEAAERVRNDANAR